MKLITHNMLSSQGLKNVKVGYPLTIESVDTKTLDVEFNEAFIARVIPKLDWTAVVGAVADVKMDKELQLAPKVPDDFETNTEFLRSAHRALLEIEVINGKLVCPESQRVFQITDGIPNMLLNEDEV